MKKRIKVDSSILSLIIIITGVLYQFPHLYSTNHVWDNILDFFGLMCVFDGTLLRMAARGHKKAHSKNSHGLVLTGFYAYTRNPMYLGSFLMGAGFVLIVWPWWALPLFGWLFYLRFKQQIFKEEDYLKKNFGEEYERYCQETPRLFPRLKSLFEKDMRKILKWDEAWSTNERRGLFLWPLLAVILETLQERIVFDIINIPQTVLIFLVSAVVYTVFFWWYQKGSSRDGVNSE